MPVHFSQEQKSCQSSENTFSPGQVPLLEPPSPINALKTISQSSSQLCRSNLCNAVDICVTTNSIKSSSIISVFLKHPNWKGWRVIWNSFRGIVWLDSLDISFSIWQMRDFLGSMYVCMYICMFNKFPFLTTFQISAMCDKKWPGPPGCFFISIFWLVCLPSPLIVPFVSHKFNQDPTYIIPIWVAIGNKGTCSCPPTTKVLNLLFFAVQTCTNWMRMMSTRQKYRYTKGPGPIKASMSKRAKCLLISPQRLPCAFKL